MATLDTPAYLSMPVSATAPLETAWARMTRLLFDPFDIGKWFIIGFAVFLSSLGEGSGSLVWQIVPRSLGISSGSNPFAWIEEHRSMILSVGSAVMLLGIAVGLVLLWIRCRGMFIVLDNIAVDQGRIGIPWSGYAPQAKSLFLFCIVFYGVLLVFWGSLAAGFLWWTWGYLKAGAIASLIPVGLLLLAVILPMAFLESILLFFINNLVVPRMFLRRSGVKQAIAESWGIVRTEVRACVVFYLLNWLVGAAVGVMLTFGICLTCCLAAIPYLGMVMLLPIWIFPRAYALSFMEQFEPPPAAEPSWTAPVSVPL